MSDRKNDSSKKIFGGLFVMVGCIILAVFVLRPIALSTLMLTWQSTPAELISTKVDSHQSRDSDGNWDTYYTAKVEYQYHYGGQRYWGNRLNISEYSSTNSNKAYKRLSDLREDFAGRLTVWVNPRQANESIIYRTPQWRLMFSLGSFAGLFGLIGWYIALSGRKATAEEAPELVSDERSKLLFFKRAVIIAVVAGTIPGGFLVLAGWWQSFFALLAYSPAIVLALVYRKKLLSWDFYDTIPLQIDGEQGVIGGALTGSLELPGEPVHGEQYLATLVCFKKSTSRSNRERRVSITQRWSDFSVLKVEAAGLYSRLRFHFEIPAHLPESEPESANHHYWQLQLRCTRKGPDFNRDYVIPVHKTAESLTVAEELVAQPLSAAEKADMAEQVDLSVGNDQQVSWHSKSDNSGLIFTAFGSLFAIIGVVIVMSGGGFMPGLFVVFGLLFASIGLAIKGRNCKIYAQADSLKVEVYSFSRLRKTHTFSASSLPDIEWFEESRSSTNGVASKAKFSLRLKLPYGERVDIGGNFDSAKAAEYMRQTLISVVKGQGAS